MSDQRTSRHRRRGRIGAALLATACVAAVPGLVATAGAGVRTTHALKPDYSYFYGKTITYVLANSVGSTSGLAVEAIVPGIERKLHATVKVEYVSGNAAIGEDQLAAAAPDGLTIGWVGVGSWLYSELQQNGTVNFSLPQQSFIGGVSSALTIVVACTGSPIQSFAELVHSPTPVRALELTSQQTTMLLRLSFAGFNIPHTNLTAYPTTASLTQGCLRGDGDIAAENASNVMNAAETAFDPGITPLFISGKYPAAYPSSFVNKMAPTIESLITKYGAKTPAAKEALKLVVPLFDATNPTQLWWAPKGVAPAKLLALQDALKYAMGQADVRAGLIADSASPTFVTPTQFHDLIKSDLTHQTILRRLLSS